jgi:hypothetical protein
MSTPPNNYITQAIWDLWLACHKEFGSRVELGGVYANKSGYHNTRAAHFTKKAKEKGWDENYSVQLDLDKQGPSDKAAAIDLSFDSEADMRLYTSRLDEAFWARDSRLASVKEFYGTLDNKTVYGLGKKSRVGAPYKTSADKSHLWHLHISFFRADVEHWDRIKGVYSVLADKGAQAPPKPSKPETPNPTTPVKTSDWTDRLIMALPTIRRGSKGTDAKRVQALAVANGRKISIDGIIGPNSEREIKAFQRSKGLVADCIVGPKTWTKLLGE